MHKSAQDFRQELRKEIIEKRIRAKRQKLFQGNAPFQSNDPQNGVKNTSAEKSGFEGLSEPIENVDLA